MALIWAIGMVSTLGGLFVLAIAPSYPVLLISAMMIGLGSAVFHPESSRVARMASGGRYGLAQSVFQVGGNIGQAISPLTAALLVATYGQRSIVWYAGLALLAILLLFNVGTWYKHHGLARIKHHQTSRDSGLSGKKIQLAMAILLLLMFSKFIYLACIGSYYTFYLIHTFGVTVQGADQGDTTTIAETVTTAAEELEAVATATNDHTAVIDEVVADKGYHSREVLKRLEEGAWTTRIAEPARRTVLRWHGDDEARRAVYANRRRLLSGIARVALVLRAVLCERTFAHVLDRGGLRRSWLRGRENVAKRYRMHVAAYNLGLIMRVLFGAGTPRAAADLGLIWLAAGDHVRLTLLVVPRTGSVGTAAPAAIIIATVMPDNGTFSTGC